jgi:penicillin-binding protein 2
MIRVRDTESHLHRLRVRLGAAWVLVLACFLLIAARFVYLQVYRYADFRAQAEDNRIALVPEAPARGLIYDRNGVLLADNVPAFTLEVTPNRVVGGIDAMLDALSQVIEIGDRDRRRFKRLLEEAKGYDSVPLRSRLGDEDLARFAAAKYRFPGVEIRARLFRTYPQGEAGSHLIGYVGRISRADRERLEERDELSEYAGTTHIGKSGVELSYEPTLHGQAGAEEVEVSASGRTVRSLSRVASTAGANVVLTIDIELQRLVEQWFGDRRGALVAIEPATGEVLAFVSKPTYDPNLFVDGIDPQVWSALSEDPDKPLLDRALRGTYPPGSTYKPFMALAALTTGVRTPEAITSDPGYFQLGNHRFRDSAPNGHGTVDLRKSIVVSSDTYYYKVAYEMGPDAIHDFMVPWGFGQLTGIDLEHEVTGVLPSSQWKMKRFKLKWLPGESPSIGIGQGYNAFTILQLAHALATLANDGLVVTPRVVRATEDPATRQRTERVAEVKARIPLRPEHLALVKSAMVDVNRFGTSRAAFAGAEYVSAGKTGTAQVVGIRQGEKYDARRIAAKHRDHSLFVAFAPAQGQAPKIAVAVIVENGGFGAQAAAPIARRVFDYYLLGKTAGATPAPAGSRAAEPDAEASPEMRDIPETIEAPVGAGEGEAK